MSLFSPRLTVAQVEEGHALAPKFDTAGLIPVVTTDAGSGEVLMMGVMNAEALTRSIATGEAHYWSRARQCLWHKGATSGLIQKIVEMRIDDDQDAIWLRVEIAGAQAAMSAIARASIARCRWAGTVRRGWSSPSPKNFSIRFSSMAMRPIPRNSDVLWMGRALVLARRMRGHVWPNPPVGCVIMKDGAVIAEGETQPGGRPHAERVALNRAGAAARGATLYVTLEPCCHWGKTPPCTDAIIAAGVARVVAAMQDPDPRVNGGGFRQLRAAGIAVTVGEGATNAAAIMSGFLHRTRTGEPELILAERAGAVPKGTDALLETRRGGHGLRLHDPGRVTEVACDLSPDGGLLRRLGGLGLTSVALWREDPLRAALSPSPA